MTTSGFDDPLLRETPVVDGYRVLGPCVIYSKIGQGGMGAVFRGRHTNLEIDIAVKCLKRSLASEDEAFVQRFQREARLAAALNDPNLIRVYDVNEQAGLHFLVMEFVEGESLRERVQRKGALAPLEAVTIVRNAAQGLGVAHARGIVHRDIKPDNILVSTQGEVKVADLGLAKAVEAKDGMTATNMVMGTPQYMPPEQWEGSAKVGAPGDVYALGATLFFLLAGEDAIAGGSLTEVLRRVCFEPFPDIAAKVPGLDPELAAIVTESAAKEAGDRPADATALRERLDAWLRAQGAPADLRDASAGLETPRCSVVSPPPAGTLSRARASSFIDLESATMPASDAGFVSPVEPPAPTRATPPPRTTATPEPPPSPGVTRTAVRREPRRLPALAIVGLTAIGVAGLLGLGLWMFNRGEDETPRSSETTAAASPTENGGDSRSDSDSSTTRTGSAEGRGAERTDPPGRSARGLSGRERRAIAGSWVMDRDAFFGHRVEKAMEAGELDPDVDVAELEGRLRREIAGMTLGFVFKPNGRFEMRSKFSGREIRGLGSWRREGDFLVVSLEFRDGRRLVKPKVDRLRYVGGELLGEGGEVEGMKLIRESAAEARAAKRRAEVGDIRGRWTLDVEATVDAAMDQIRRDLIEAGGALPELGDIERDRREMMSLVSVDLVIDDRSFRMQVRGVDGTDEGRIEGDWEPRGAGFEFISTKEDGEEQLPSSRELIQGRLSGKKLVFRSEDEPMVFRRK